jgi:hypothetical protein
VPGAVPPCGRGARPGGGRLWVPGRGDPGTQPGRRSSCGYYTTAPFLFDTLIRGSLIYAVPPPRLRPMREHPLGQRLLGAGERPASRAAPDRELESLIGARPQNPALLPVKDRAPLPRNRGGCVAKTERVC